MAELFELHDRARFEAIAISTGVNDGSDMRKRLVASFDHFIDARGLSDAAIAQRMRDMGVHIAVDLKGHTQHGRLGVFAHRPAPVQVAYLGFPCTSGADFIDYLIADAIIIPLEEEKFYSEKIVRLPGCYQANDRKRAIADETPTRAECGLPERGFVFCSFNHNYKLTPPMFDVWMRILQAVPDSVFWLYAGDDRCKDNLRREAEARGVDPQRLVFADRLPLDQHLARHRLADLFLDGVPCNAHTTASDALWAGLPVLTVPGRSFTARVCASLVTAAGLPELIAADLPAYEQTAIALARDPAALASLRARLAATRGQAPLFDSDRLRRSLEAAYGEMIARWRAGLPPAALSPSP
jgi:predicted O-linked N-acetylglucosamine transferase (SPINDLY family)